MVRWRLEQLQGYLIISDLAKGTVGLIAVGLLFDLLFNTPTIGKSSSQLPQTAEEFLDRAYHLHGQLDYKGAMKDVQQAIRLNPNLAKAYVMRGSFHVVDKRRQSGFEDYRQAISLYQQQNRMFEAETLEKEIQKIQQQQSPACLPSDPEKPWACIR